MSSSPNEVKVLESVILVKPPADPDNKSPETLSDVGVKCVDPIEDEISAIVHHEEPSSTDENMTQAIYAGLENQLTHSDDAEKQKAIQQLEETKLAEMKGKDGSKSKSTKTESDGSDKNGGEALASNVQIEEPDSQFEELATIEVENISATKKTNSSASQPIVESEMEKLDDEDLIAILKGTDCNTSNAEVIIEGEGQFEVLEVVDDESQSSTHAPNSHKVLSKEEERSIALSQIQMMPLLKARRRKQDISQTLSTDLVTSLASDWSEDDNEKDEAKPKTQKEKPIVKKISPALSPPSGVFKRQRIVKKKIIWDPDAPETQISYASLLKPVPATVKKVAPAKKTIKPAVKVEAVEKQTSMNNLKAALEAAKKDAQKKGRTTPLPKKSQTEEAKIAKVTELAPKTPVKRRSETPTSAGQKRKKITEVDKLLGDEGAANMINSIESGARHKTEKDTKVSTPEKTVVKKTRTQKPKASSSWDFVYNQQSDDAMIIRRRSNSSYSSTASPRRLSLDFSAQKNESGNTSIDTTSPSSSAQKFEFAKPEVKKNNRTSKNDTLEDAAIARDMKKGGTTRKAAPAKATAPTTTEKSTKAGEEGKSGVTVRQAAEHVMELVLDLKFAKTKNTFNSKLMDGICVQLETLKNDKECKVVVLTTSGQHFCQGIDYSDLAGGSAEKRKSSAQELAKCVRNLFHTLATFPKPLVAGVMGHISGLGVMLLPLFDITIGSDKSTYETSYVQIGQLPEGFCLFNSDESIQKSCKTKLLWLCEKLSASESQSGGLVNKLIGPTKVHEEALNTAKKIAGFSSQAYQAMKEQQLKHVLSKILPALDDEQKILAQYWSSAEFHDKLKQFNQKE